MHQVLDNIKNEPVVMVGIIEAVLVVLAAFHFDLSQEQIAAIMLLATAILTPAARSQVTPVRKLNAQKGTGVEE